MTGEPRALLRVLAAALVAVTTAPVAASGAAAATEPEPTAAAVEARARFGPLGRLAGSCWTGSAPGGHTDVHCYRWQWGGHFLRDRHVVEAAKGEQPYEGETLYVWDAERERVVFTYWSSVGAVVRGEAIFDAPDAREVVFPEQVAGKQGARDLRTVWRFVGEDRYESIVEERRDGEWRPLWTAIFRRTGPAPGAAAGR